LFNSGHVNRRGDLRAREVDVTNADCEALGKGAEGWSCNMLVKAWIAEHIYILHGWGNFKNNISLGGTSNKILGLSCLVQSVWEKAVSRVAWASARIKGSNMREHMEVSFGHGWAEHRKLVGRRGDLGFWSKPAVVAVCGRAGEL
jgi:hypothetical protein